MSFSCQESPGCHLITLYYLDRLLFFCLVFSLFLFCLLLLLLLLLLFLLLLFLLLLETFHLTDIFPEESPTLFVKS